MASQEKISITYYVGALNILLALIWGALYGFGVLDSNNISSASAMPFYVGTLFVAGFGVIFPSLEKTMSARSKINLGFGLSVVSLVMYAAYVGAYFYFKTLLLPFMQGNEIRNMF